MDAHRDALRLELLLPLAGANLSGFTMRVTGYTLEPTEPACSERRGVRSGRKRAHHAGGRRRYSGQWAGVAGRESLHR